MSRRCLIVGLRAFAVAFVLLTLAPAMRAGEETREFAEQNCRYTLPGKDWSWRELSQSYKDDGTLFIAKNSGGLQVMLAAEKRPREAILDQRTVDEFEKELRTDASLVKRGGHFSTFQGVPSYQFDLVMKQKTTAANRIFFAHGFVYSLCARGGTNAVEDDPAFEKIMAGFAFTTPPTQVPEPGQQAPPPTRDISFRMGEIAAICMLLAIAAHFFTRLFGRKRPAA